MIEAGWNFAQIYYSSLNDIMNLKTRVLLEGQFRMAFEINEEIISRVSFKPSKKEMEDLMKIQSTLRNFILIYDKQKNQAIELKILDKFRQVDREIMRLMDKYKMILPPNAKGYGDIRNITKRLKIDDQS